MGLQSLTLQMSEHSAAGGQPLVVLMATSSGWTPTITCFLVSMGISMALLLGPSACPSSAKVLGLKRQGPIYREYHTYHGGQKDMTFSRTHTGGLEEQEWVLNLILQDESQDFSIHFVLPIEESRNWGQALGIRQNCTPGKSFPSISFHTCSRKFWSSQSGSREGRPEDWDKLLHSI